MSIKKISKEQPETFGFSAENLLEAKEIIKNILKENNRAQ